MAGDGQPAYAGDGGAATSAQILPVEALAADSFGRLYIADSSRVRMVASNGMINTIGGNGTVGSTGDGGSAISAAITPLSLAAGPNGAVYLGQKFSVRLLLPPAPASVTSITSPNVNGGYGAGASITLRMLFNEPVTVAGTSQLFLNSGGTATYIAGSGTTTLTFSYLVQNGQSTSALDTASINGLNLNGGSIRDSFGTGATLLLPAAQTAGSLSASRHLVINTTAASFTLSGQVTAAGHPLAGVSITLDNGATAVTNASGAFSLMGLAAGATYTATPSFSGYSFTPANWSIPTIAANQSVSFVAAGNSGSLTFVPITPCRIVDTRRANGALGGPLLAGAATRQFSLPGTCGIPSSAAAYSLNVTAVPVGRLNYLAIWPSGPGKAGRLHAEL